MARNLKRGFGELMQTFMQRRRKPSVHGVRIGDKGIKHGRSYLICLHYISVIIFKKLKKCR
jgi:hypothetical protein